ncbi:MAG TPA: murein biosynthesis integral membrane protein MurJ [Rhizomicrobium sp.]|jgi:putative peptidoglycan lipid II flippase|nr:murein biosynthesis integral membrane protein MurJ [Rhizomicrobium sp.]
MLRRLLSVGGFTLLSRIAGFIQNIVMAAILGDGLLSDAYFVALRLPNSFRGIFAEGAFNVAFIPRYAALRTREGDDAAFRFADRVFSWQMAAQLALLLAALVFMPQIVAIMAPGFSQHAGQVALAVDFSRITFPYLILTVVAVQLSAMLNAHEKFAAAAFWSIFLNLAVIATLLLSRHFTNAGYAASWGVLLAGFLQLFFIVWAAARAGLSLRLAWPRWSAQMKEFLLALGAATLGSASVQIGLFVDTIIASFLPAGVLTAINYADRVNQLPLGTLGIALATVLLPEMSRRVAENDRKGADAAQNNAAALGLFLTLPFAAAFLLVPQTIMRALFAHGAFSISAADISAGALSAYGVGLPAFVLVRVVAATFYSRGDTATPVRATILAVAVNIGMKIVLVWGFHLGAVGVALGTSLGSWANVSLLLWLALRRDLLTIETHFTRALPAILLGAAATGAAALLGVMVADSHLQAMHFRKEILLAAAIVPAALAYGLVALGFRRALPLGRLSAKV